MIVSTPSTWHDQVGRSLCAFCLIEFWWSGEGWKDSSWFILSVRTPNEVAKWKAKIHSYRLRTPRDLADSKMFQYICSKLRFQGFFLELQLLVSAAMRIRQGLEDGCILDGLVEVDWAESIGFLENGSLWKGFNLFNPTCKQENTQVETHWFWTESNTHDTGYFDLISWYWH